MAWWHREENQIKSKKEKKGSKFNSKNQTEKSPFLANANGLLQNLLKKSNFWHFICGPTTGQLRLILTYQYPGPSFPNASTPQNLAQNSFFLYSVWKKGEGSITERLGVLKVAERACTLAEHPRHTPTRHSTYTIWVSRNTKQIVAVVSKTREEKRIMHRPAV